ncbi:hypothetical protein [Myroides sp. LJL119]
MKKIFSLLTVALLSFSIFSCSSDDNYIDLSDHAGGFTMVNAYEGDQAIFYVADGRPIQNPYYPIPYRGVNYVNLWQGNRFIKAYGIGESEPIFSSEQDIVSGQYYTSFVAGTKQKPIYFITQDLAKKATPLDQTKQSGVRLFNLSSDDLIITVEFNNDLLVKDFENRPQDNLATVQTSEQFVAIDSNTYTISIKDKAGNVLASREGVDFSPSYFYSIILIGNKSNSQTPYYIGIINQAVN